MSEHTRWSHTLPVLALAWAVSFCTPGPVDQEHLEEMAREALAQIEGTIAIAGLEQEVEVLRDRWGVPHIYAQTVDDLFFAQGFVAAQDRLWQLEMWRRVGEGRVAEIVGPGAFERDRVARLLRYRGDMEAEWTSYHPDGERIITSFVRGVNAFIEHSRENPPVEFKLTGIQPEPWSVEVPLLRMAGLPMTDNALGEMRLALRVGQVGVEEANRRDAPDPWQELRVPEGLDVGALPDTVLEIIGAAYAGMPRPPLVEPYRSPAAASPAGRGDAGSNNWVVAGRLTATGAPILANDPHRSIIVPSLRYLVHLNGPGWNVIGSGEPALPGVAIGHNERIAWGLTIVGIDQQDIVVEEVNPQNRNEVRWNGSWEPLRVEFDTIRVKGEDPRVVELKFSRHGPILYEDTVIHRAYAFRSVLAEPGTAGYLGSLRVDQARNWNEYLEAMKAWKVPSENMIYADVDGNIGWQAAGLTPVRDGWYGRLPVPGTGEYEWRGFLPLERLPREYNPARGFIATANHNIMPEGYEPPLGFDWASPRRYLRIVDVLSAGGDFDVEDYQRLQLDVYSSAAARACATLQTWTATTDATERARRMLVEWDAEIDRDSPAAALYHAWRDTLDGRALREATPGALRDSLVELALAAAVGRLEAEQGTDWTAWRWGPMNEIQFPHPLGIPAFELPAVGRSGDRTTVNVAGRSSGASFREIIDLADWDRSVATSTPGQSGQPGGPHYGDLLPLWAEGRYFPLLFTREAVEANAAHRLVLRPPPR
ncbi:MAG: penicillin acylase family protein [Gemmatimonadota bacterium]|nr:MAG: penicillin acylase family protein [Gemmatimonadota bacterium]